MKQTTTQHNSDSLAKGNVRSRERLLSIRIRASSLFSTSVFAVAALLALLSVFGSSDGDGLLSAASLGWRDPASRPFPNVGKTDDADDMIKEYKPYLEFVATVGEGVDPRTTKVLKAKWADLHKRDRTGAARFLKLLKFEMDQHLQLTGGSSKRMHSDSPAVRAWVKRYIKDWSREVDEHLFRGYALRMSAKYSIAKAE